MIPAIFLQLRDQLKAKGVPYECVYGPSQIPLRIGATRIEMCRDIDAGDLVLPARSIHRNPPHYAVRACGALVRIYSHSARENATRGDHEDLSDQIVDMVNVALAKIVRVRRTLWRIVRAGFVTNVAVTDGWSGVVYELRFQIDRGVSDVLWTGEKAPEGSFTTGATTLDASGPGGSTALPDADTRLSE